MRLVCSRRAAATSLRHGRAGGPFSSSIPASAGFRCWPRSAALLPDAPIVYAADNAGFPYGTKSAAEIAARVPALLGRLAERYDPALIVIACNTASTIALDAVRAALDLPIVGTVPAIKPAAALSKTRAIGVLGTDATIVQPYVDRLAAEFAADCIVVRHGSAELVELRRGQAARRGDRSPPLMPASSTACSRPARRRAGSTRSSSPAPISRWSEDELAAAAPRPLAFVDGNDGIARRTAWLARDLAWPDGRRRGHRRLHRPPAPKPIARASPATG